MVTIDSGDYENQLRDAVEELAEFAYRNKLRILGDPPNRAKLADELDDLLRPGAGNPVRRMDTSKFRGLISWVFKESRESFDLHSQDRWGRLRQAYKKLMDLLEWSELSGGEPPDYQNILDGYTRDNTEPVLAGTQKILEAIRDQVEGALQRVPYWNSGGVTLTPHFSKDHYLKPIGAASVAVGKAEFTVFVSDTGKIEEIEDVIEGGDEDSFKNVEEQADYFNLINELRHPGSTTKGKLMTLYTARPTKDRSLYEGARTIPPNVFLTSRFDDAEGIAHDLGGNEVRDVWKVRINTSYLVKTLDTPSVKQYQVVGSRPAPVEKIELISLGESSARVAHRYLTGCPK